MNTHVQDENLLLLSYDIGDNSLNYGSRGKSLRKAGELLY